MEAVLKLVNQYHVANGEPERKHYIARYQSYHGGTLATLNLGYYKKRREGNEIHFQDHFHHVSPCYEYRERSEDETITDFVERKKQELEKMFQDIGPRKVAAVVLEPIVGAVSLRFFIFSALSWVTGILPSDFTYMHVVVTQQLQLTNYRS